MPSTLKVVIINFIGVDNKSRNDKPKIVEQTNITMSVIKKYYNIE